MKTILNTLLLGFVTTFLGAYSWGQISVTGGQTAQQLADQLAGPNITVTNAQLTGGGSASGNFIGTNSTLGFDSGVVLSTGDVSSSEGPNDDTNSGENLGQPGTAQMDALVATANSFDAVTLEFDFEVQSSLIQFNYVFASEEYPEYAPPNNSGFNDVFAFYISGPGITGEENIALVPNSTSPVSINNINPVTNSQYYVDNTGGTDVQFDGFTTILEAKRSNLTPCQTYHLKLVIADGGDGAYNSAVFLQENSLVQGIVDVQTQTVNADNIALEGCIPASFTFSFDDISNQDRIINYVVGGSAVNGVDYQFVDSAMTIVAGDTSATIYIDAFSDGLTEGQESIWIIYQPAACADYDTAYLYIDDAQPIDFSLDGFDLDCFEDNSGEIQVNASGGFPPYTYNVTYPDNSQADTQTNPITGLEAGTYSVQVTDSYGCQADALVIGGVYDADTTFLPDVPNGQVTTYDAPLPIAGFDNGQVINNVNQIQQICLTMEHSYLGDLQIEVESPSGQTVILKQQNGGGSCDLGEPIATAPVDGQASSTLTDPGSGYEYCFNANPVYGTMVGESNNFTRNYTDAQGNSYTDTYLPAGSYTPFEDFSALVGSDMNGTWTVHVTDQFGLDNGYIFNWYISLVGDLPDTTVTLIQPEEIATSGFVTNSTCGGTDGAINIDIVGAVAPYTVLWSSGQTTEDISGIAAGTYTVTVTDANGCQSEETFLVNNVGSLDITGVSTATSCSGGTDGSIDITGTGGQTPYTFTWDSGQTTEDISGLTAGDYTVTMQDQQGCVISELISVSDADAIMITSVSISNEECNTDNGSIDVSVAGGTGSFGYQWSNGASTEDISGLTAGTYVIDVIDGNGCTASATYPIVNDVSNCSAFCFIEVEENVLSDELCGSGNGSIDINVLNAVAPVSYSWSNGATTEDISGLSEGSYTVVVTDANNCSEVMTFVVANNTGNLTVSNASIGEENCGNANGSIDITVTGGAMPYSFLWSDASTTEDLTGLTAGSYSVTITDGNGCQTTETYTVVNNAGTLAATATIIPELCTSSNGSINQTVTGGNGILTYTWDSGQTTQDISGLSTGTYICNITDETGCYIVNTYVVDQTSGDISLVGSNITNEVCGNGQGEINITLTGNNLTYLWSNGATTEDVTGLSAGNYTCTITNLQGCSFTTPVFSVINASGTLSVSTQLVTEEVCGNGNGSINMNVSGGTMPYTYAWSNGATNEDLIGLTAGTYTLTVSDANGCSESHSIVVGSNSGTLSIQNAVVTDETCGDGTGAIDVVIIGGTAPLSYSWSNGSTTEDLTGLSAGTYILTVTDANGCSEIQTYVVNNQANAIAYTSSITNEICSNTSGSVALTVTGGTAPYTYAWSNGGTNASISGLASGVYSCTITDALGCSVLTSDFTVGNTASGMSGATVVTDAACGPNGSIDLTITGGTAPINVVWSNAVTTEDISGLGQGVYTYTATDANGCVVTGTATVTETNANLTYTYTTTSEVCGNGLGSVDLTPNGGVAPYSFAWSGGETTEDIAGQSAGTYTCVITDANGCSITTSGIQITDLPGNLNISNVVATDETCSNGFGSIDISITGGTAPINYVWSEGSTTEDISNLSSGTYSVTVTDANGCEATTQAVINSSAGSLGIVQPIVTNENCSNGQGGIDISLTGEANPVTYLWSDGSTNQDASNLVAGVYTVTVTDANGCTTTGTYTVTNTGTSLALPSANITDEYCGSGSGAVSVSVAGGSAPYNYAWSNGATTSTISNLSAGTYTVTVTDAGGCQVVGSYTVANNAGNLMVTGVTTDENCGDGTGAIDITTTGGNMPLTYSWSSGETTEDLSNLNEGTYIITVTDNFGCNSIYTSVVNNISGGLGITVDATTDENCGQSDGSIDVTVTGTGIVSTVWSSGQTTEDISGIAAGSYTLTVTDGVGCSVQATATVANQTGTMAMTFTNVGDENCQNGQGFVDIEMTGTGSFTYLWSDGQTTQDAIGLSAGVYTVTITDGVGCEMIQTFTVNNINTTNLNGSGVVTDAFCTAANGEIDLTVNGGLTPYTFLWDNGDVTEDILNLTPGTYVVTITDAANCAVNETIVVGSQNSGLGFTNLNITDEFCGQGDGEIVYFTGGTADDYYLDGVNLGGWTADNLSAGTYLASISDNFGCTADTTVTVGANAFFNVTHTQVDETCNSGNAEIDITVQGGGPGGGTFDYSWDTGAVTEDLTGLSAGTYVVTVSTTGGFNCSLDYTVVITNTSTFEVNGSVTDEYCGAADGAIDQTVVSGSGLTYAWSHGPTTEDVSGLSAGTYTVTITDPAPGGCIESIDYVVNGSTNGAMITGVVTDETCLSSNGAIDVTITGGSGSFTYAWDNSETTEDVSAVSNGTYVLTVIDQNDSCTFSETFTVGNSNTVFNGTGVVTNATCATCLDGEIDITLGNSGNTYLWSNSETTEDVTDLNPGTYSVTVTSPEGCDTTMTFEVMNTASIEENEALNISMTIAPNPATNQFTIDYKLMDGQDGEVVITDALGKLVFTQSIVGENTLIVSSSEFANGMYFVTLKSRKITKMERLVISN